MNDVTKSYRPYLKHFRKDMGAPPSADHFNTAHGLGARIGSKVAMAIAMYLRPQGATQGQVVTVCGGPQLNKMRGLIEAGFLKRGNLPNNEAGHTVYHVELSARGAKAIAKKADGDKPAKKAKRKKADPVADETPAVNEQPTT